MINGEIATASTHSRVSEDRRFGHQLREQRGCLESINHASSFGSGLLQISFEGRNPLVFHLKLNSEQHLAAIHR